MLRQFENDANEDAHYAGTGPEIWEQCDGRVDALVAGVGTGGTLVGAGRFLKERNPNALVVGVEPAESRVLQGGADRVHGLTGVGAGFGVPMLERLAPGEPFKAGPRGIVDEFAACSTADGLDTALALARTQGLLLGPSTGAAVRCALELAARPSSAGFTVVVVAPSSGTRYLSHPMFKALRDEADAALSEESAGGPGAAAPTGAREAVPRRPATPDPGEREAALALASRVEERILGLAREALGYPELGAEESLVDAGANSFTAMLLLGKLRGALQGVEGLGELRSLKLAIMRERVWGSVRDLALGVLGLCPDGTPLPEDPGGATEPTTRGALVVEYCGG